ncbi:hypothetical protein WA026_004185 [Henosepilachna vigintioctopunctata]|uniref:WW domain-containing protein n=1 Tax=Henosepilachna vigintioctopunctata TaxID=420089 RepID=A0AAW1U8S4_9CUCU
MDSTLNEFLNEINEIAPLKTIKNESGWKKCFDAKSGFPYYWNTLTDEVTWEEPKTFNSSKSITSSDPPSYHTSSIPELFDKVKDTVKIYKIASTVNTPIPTKVPTNRIPSESVKNPSKKFKRGSDFDDEKITLITSYGSDSESEGDEENIDNSSESSKSVRAEKSYSDDEDNDILSTVRKRAEELNKFGQADIKNIIIKAEETNHIPQLPKVKPLTAGFSLVAGYDSNSEDEETDESKIEIKKIKDPIQNQKTYSHSTLFPIVKPPDVNDFIETREVTPKPPLNQDSENSFDSKNFQRKRRLGVNFVPTQRSNMNVSSPVPLDGERKGLGFDTSNLNSNNSKSTTSIYSNFTRGGVEFAKSTTLEDSESKENDDDVAIEQISNIYEILREKLAFLCEGNKDVLPVQIILIQIETLYGALKAKCLKSSYLHDWLKGTSEDLVKLEKEAAPEGWLLQWDRSRKRYYYQNQLTGEGRWEYPLPDAVHQEEAMDISTTPPPLEAEEEHPLLVEQPPLPPSPPCKSPSPPPPPVISVSDSQPIPEPPSAPKISLEPEEQPPPPGVDLSESAGYKTDQQQSTTNDIDLEFDSFYSELRTIEHTSNTPSPSNIIEELQKTEVQESNLIEQPKKKKKKVKMGQGLSLKKKDVSKLVEKWKNVQKNF